MITQDDVIYFVVTDRFFNGDLSHNQDVDPTNPHAFHGGNFAGLIQKIPYFQALGVTAIWLTPVYVNITDYFDQAGYHGYWAMDFERVDPHLVKAQPGVTNDNRTHLTELVNTFHQAGLKVILDMVVNHTGYHTPKYQEYPYKRFESRHFNRSQNNEVEQWLYGLPDLDHDQPEVADYFVQNILDWIEATGIDAIRMDTVKHVEDTFWYFFKSQIKTRYPQVTLLGEVLDPNPSVIGRYQQEHDFDTLFDFPLREAIMQTLVYDHPLTKLARPRLNDHEPQGVLDQNKPYTNANRLVTLLDNHDLGQRFTTDILDRVGHQDRELACKILKLCLTFLFTTRGIPQIYYGTEIGMEGRKDPDNRRDMVWSVFGSDQRPTADHWFEREIFDHLRSLIQFRSQNPAIRYGCLLTLFVDQFVYVYLREFRGNVVLVAINNGQGDMPVPLPIQIKDNRHLPPRVNGLLTEGRRFRAFFSHLPNLIVQTNQVAIQLPGKTAGVYVLELE